MTLFPLPPPDPAVRLRFSVPVKPHAQIRLRATRWGKPYDDPRQKRETKKLVLSLWPYRPEKPLAGPLTVKITAWLPTFKSWGKTRLQRARSGLDLPTARLDVDNLAKHILDCLTKARFWADDGQVTDLRIAKRYDDGQGPRWEVEIENGGGD